MTTNTLPGSVVPDLPITIPSYTYTNPAVSKEDVLFASASVVEDADGTVKRPYLLDKAIEEMKAGTTIYLLPGTYVIESGLALTKAGSETNRNSIIAITNDTTFDFDGNSGLTIASSYWYIYNIKFTNSNGTGCKVTGNGNIIEGCVSYENAGSGFACGEGTSSSANNQFRKCVAKDNYGRGDSCGFSIVGTGLDNILDNCISYQNEKSGFYIYARKSVLATNCIAIANGMSGSGVPNTMGIGFDFSDADHVFENCTAFMNAGSGFYVTCSNGTITINNSSSINNGVNYLTSNGGSTAMEIMNSLSYNTSGTGLKDTITGECMNCIFYVNSTYYYTGVTERTIDTINDSEENLGTELTTPQKSAYLINVTIPSGFDPCNLMTIDGIYIANDFLGRNESFQNKVIPTSLEIEYFGSKYNTV